jgi:hypothetical protein
MTDHLREEHERECQAVAHDRRKTRPLALKVVEEIELGLRPIDALDQDAVRDELVHTLYASVALLYAVDVLKQWEADLRALYAEHRPTEEAQDG